MTEAGAATFERHGTPLVRRLVTSVLVVAALWALWEGYKWLWQTAGWTWPFAVDDTTMPHLHDIVAAFWQPTTTGGPPLIHSLIDAAWFTMKEALAGFLIGAIVGFLLAVVLSQSRFLERGILPYIVASQTIPILAIAPMVVVWLGSRGAPGWVSVSVISAYLTFFPVTINTLRGLLSADPRALELMRSYAAGRWSVLWRLRVPASMPYLFAALKIAAPAAVVGAIIGELPSGIQDGLAGAILNFNQYYVLAPQNLWATNMVAAVVGIAFFLCVVLAERLVVHRAPENVA